MEIAHLLDWVVGITTLTALELVLGIDNVVLLTIIVDKLPEDQRPAIRKLGLTLAMAFRVLLLLTIAWLTAMTAPLFSLFEHAFSLRDIILILGGLFLIYKAAIEILHFVEARKPSLPEKELEGLPCAAVRKKKTTVIVGQVVLFDLIFSLDSVLTAVGLAKDLAVMVIAVILAACLMLIFAKAISDFVSGNPAIKMLALSFLVMIGTLLVAEGFGSHFDRGYIYFAMAFSLAVELLNTRRRGKSKEET